MVCHVPNAYQERRWAGEHDRSDSQKDEKMAKINRYTLRQTVYRERNSRPLANRLIHLLAVAGQAVAQSVQCQQPANNPQNEQPKREVKIQQFEDDRAETEENREQ